MEVRETKTLVNDDDVGIVIDAEGNVRYFLPDKNEAVDPENTSAQLLKLFALVAALKQDELMDVLTDQARELIRASIAQLTTPQDAVVPTEEESPGE